MCFLVNKFSFQDFHLNKPMSYYINLLFKHKTFSLPTKNSFFLIKSDGYFLVI